MDLKHPPLHLDLDLLHPPQGISLPNTAREGGSLLHRTGGHASFVPLNPLWPERQADRGSRWGGKARERNRQDRSPGHLDAGGRPRKPDSLQKIGSPQKIGHEGGLRAMINLCGRPDLLETPALHDRQPIGQTKSLLLVMGNV